MDPLYKEYLVDRYAKKRNFGELKGKTHEVERQHVGCSDNLILDLRVENEVLIDARFRGKTCFISTIAADSLIDNVKGMKVEDILKLNKSDMDKFLGTEIISTRIGCELFPLETLKKALEDKQ